MDMKQWTILYHIYVNFIKYNNSFPFCTETLSRQRLVYSREIRKGPSTKDVRQMGRGGGFEISDITGRGEGGWFVKVRTSESF